MSNAVVAMHGIKHVAQQSCDRPWCKGPRVSVLHAGQWLHAELLLPLLGFTITG